MCCSPWKREWQLLQRLVLRLTVSPVREIFLPRLCHGLEWSVPLCLCLSVLLWLGSQDKVSLGFSNSQHE